MFFILPSSLSSFLTCLTKPSGPHINTMLESTKSEASRKGGGVSRKKLRRSWRCSYFVESSSQPLTFFALFDPQKLDDPRPGHAPHAQFFGCALAGLAGEEFHLYFSATLGHGLLARVRIFRHLGGSLIYNTSFTI